MSDNAVEEKEDGSTHDPAAIRWVTQKWVENQMKTNEHEFTTNVGVTIFCGTWNVNAKKQDGGLHDWLIPDPTQREPSDIYAVGFQEIVDLNALNVAINSSGTQSKSQFWKESIADCLASTKVDYSLVMDKSLVGMLLCVFVKTSLLSNVKDVRATSTGCGIMGMLGNKGAVAIRFSLFDSSVCFVCAHLAAHRENVAGRNADFKNIIERSLFESINTENDISVHRASVSGGGNEKMIEEIEMPRYGAAQLLGMDLSILDHELVFFLGDLNYRISEDLNIDEVNSKITAQDWAGLRRMDQLNIERAKGMVFQGFEEGLLVFPPTYKYQPGTDAYDTRAEKKIRCPAWCDRILYRAAAKQQLTDDFKFDQQLAETFGVDSRKDNAKAVEVKMLVYKHAVALKASDHKPVSGLFQCELKKVVGNKEHEVFQALRSVLSSHAGAFSKIPKITVTGLTIKIDKLYYDRQQHSKIEIKNVGESIAHWHFAKKSGEKSDIIAKRWITLNCTSGLLLPGESSTVVVTVKVDQKMAQQLNVGEDSLEDILVIRCQKYMDFYVTISCCYQRSCFGMSLEELVCCLQPVRSTGLPGDEDTVDTHARYRSTRKERLSIPKELWRLVDAVYGTPNAIKQKDLFRNAGTLTEMNAIREALDTGSMLPANCSVHSVVHTLLNFITALPMPLLPPILYPTSEVEPVNLRPVCRKLLEDLPHLNYNTFVYIISFLREVLAEEIYNRTTPKVLANMCVGAMTYYPELDAKIKGNKEECAKWVERQRFMHPLLMFLLTTPSI